MSHSTVPHSPTNTDPSLPEEFKEVHGSRFHAAWVKHWGNPVELIDGGQRMKVHNVLHRNEQICILKDYPRILSDIFKAKDEGAGGCALVGSPGIGA